jgi:hypothetical protein
VPGYLVIYLIIFYLLEVFIIPANNPLSVICLKIIFSWLDMEAYIYNPRTWEASLGYIGETLSEKQ